jgi:hypothetical protein
MPGKPTDREVESEEQLREIVARGVSYARTLPPT